MMREQICRYLSIAVAVLFSSVTSYGASNNLPQNGSVNTGTGAKTFYSTFVDNNNCKWFLTELGIVSFTDNKWILHNENSKICSSNLNDFAYKNTASGSEFWVVSPTGATVSSLPFDSKTDAKTYIADDASMISSNVKKVTITNGPLRWFATDKGVAAFSGNKWLALSYDDTYPYAMFQEFPITSIATSPSGDTLYVATDGAGIARVFRNDVDVITGASVYAQWGPIILPSDKVFSVYVTPTGTKWFGTDQGVAKHMGSNTLDNWTVYTTAEGLVNNFVQAITADRNGNMWFGTKGGGISVFDGSAWKTYTTDNGLNSNNILCLTVDNDGIVWIGTDNGVNSYNGTSFSSFK